MEEIPLTAAQYLAAGPQPLNVHVHTLRDMVCAVERMRREGMPLDTPLHFVLHDNDPNVEFWVAIYAGEEGMWEVDAEPLPVMIAEPNIDNVQWDAHPFGEGVTPIECPALQHRSGS